MQGNIWWLKLANPRRFVDSIVTTAKEGKSIILSMPQVIPWEADFYETVQLELERAFPIKLFKYVDDVGNDVGKFFLDRFCKEEKRLQYRGNKSYAKFLGESDDITLHDRVLWVKNFPVELYNDCLNFISEYYMCRGNKNAAVFIFEIRDKDVHNASRKHLVNISFESQISDYDKYSFCTILAAEANCDTAVRPYLADLVSLVCKNDIELSAECVVSWPVFINDPVKGLERICENRCRSNGEQYLLNVDEGEIEGSIWEAQIRNVFPILERYRMKFIASNREKIASILKSHDIHNAESEVLSDPLDVELGTLCYMSASGLLQLTPPVNSELHAYKEARNALAHMKLLEYSSVMKFLKKR